MTFRIHNKTEKMNNTNAKKALDKIYDLLIENKINPKLCYGTLLGAIRNNDFIKTDGDIDLIITKNNQLKASNLIKKNIEYETFLCEDDVIKIRLYEISLDIYCISQNTIDKLIQRYTWKHNWKKRHIGLIYLLNNTNYAKIQDKKYLTLNHPERFLKTIYGYDWKIPQNKKGNSWTLTTELIYLLTIYRKYQIRILIKNIRLTLKKNKLLYKLYLVIK
jgi:phosphorylcholine metabolism protein LicD